FADRSTYQSQCHRFRLELLGGAATQTVPQQRNERLGARVDTAPLLPKRQGISVPQQRFRHQFAKPGLVEHECGARVPALDGVAQAVTFSAVEEQPLIRFGYRRLASQMAHIDAAIGEHQMRRPRTLLGALVSAIATANHVADRDGLGSQQQLYGKFRHVAKIVASLLRWQMPQGSGADRPYSQTLGSGDNRQSPRAIVIA